MLALFESMVPAYDDGSYNNGRVHFLAPRHALSRGLALTDAHLRRYPGMVAVLADRCMVRLEAGFEAERALRDCNEAIAAEPGQPTARQARALLHLRARRWAEARRDFDALLASEAARCGRALRPRARPSRRRRPGRGAARRGSGAPL